MENKAKIATHPEFTSGATARGNDPRPARSGITQQTGRVFTTRRVINNQDTTKDIPKGSRFKG